MPPEVVGVALSEAICVPHSIVSAIANLWEPKGKAIQQLCIDVVRINNEAMNLIAICALRDDESTCPDPRTVSAQRFAQGKNNPKTVGSCESLPPSLPRPF